MARKFRRDTRSNENCTTTINPIIIVPVVSEKIIKRVCETHGFLI